MKKILLHINTFSYSHFIKTTWATLIVCILFVGNVAAQNNASDVFIDPNKGTQNSRVDFNVTGNQVESIITNWGSVGNGNGSINQAGVWPKGTGHGHLHEMTGMILTRTQDINGDTVTVIADGYGASSDASDVDPNTNIRWKFQPLPGYLNASASEPEIANSRNPGSWPASWPDQGSEYDGLWNGYFGLNQFNADQEVFYVMDDLSNTEYEYYPINGNQEDGGLGLQVRVRLFQWSQALAKDILFIQYEVSNIGDQTYTTDIENKPIIFGGYTDVNPAGSGTSDDAAGFDNDEDIVFGFSSTGQGSWQQFRDIPPGHIGWKFLESPGLDFDLTDNDNDGLVDETRDNSAGTFAFAPCGNYRDAVEHWSGDEDCDWNELIDDVGSDGIGPEQEGYPGPDADGTEGNGKPDQGEPNFGRLDNDESDQIGLTSFYAPLFGAVNIHDEETVWPNVQPGFFDVPSQGVNQIWIFGSGAFQLAPNTSQRFSTSFVFGANEQAMFRSAAVAQRIYDSDYRFAVPPKQPKLRAIAGDGKVTLVWDALAEISRDPVYGEDFEGYRIIKSTDPQFNDAEDVTDSFGNAVYKRSVAQYDKINGLTGYHDLQFGEEIGIPNGVHYYMGDDTGLQHTFTDTDVINGITYYYALIAYDAGYDNTYFDREISGLENLFPISPSESPASITQTQGVITNFDPNTVEVTPNPPASDLVLGTIDADEQGRLHKESGQSTGLVKASIVDEDLLVDDRFSVLFEQAPVVYSGNDTSGVEFETTSFYIVNDQGQIVDSSAVPTDLNDEFVLNWTYELLDLGLILEFNNQEPNESNTQQNSGFTSSSETNLRSQVTLPSPTFSTPNPPIWPIRVVIEVGDDGQVLDSAFTSRSGNISFPVNFRLYERNTGNDIKFVFEEPDSTENGKIDQDELIQLLFKKRPSDSQYTIAWNIKFAKPVDSNGNDLPDNEINIPILGDQFELNAQIPFGENDRYEINSTSSYKDSTANESILDEIIVVPNPYVAATIAEKKPFLASGRGPQMIEFRNVPSKARLRIYSSSGVFIRELQSQDGIVTWDIKSKDGLDVSFGLYFYHVNAPGIGEKTGKFAIIK